MILVITLITSKTVITHLVDTLRPRSVPLIVYPYRSHNTRQSFVESALASPPILRSYIYFPSSACIYSAGVSMPSRINQKKSFRGSFVLKRLKKISSRNFPKPTKLPLKLIYECFSPQCLKLYTTFLKGVKKKRAVTQRR